VPPSTARLGLVVEDDEVEAGAAQVVAGRQPGLSPDDDDLGVAGRHAETGTVAASAAEMRLSTSGTSQ
jgi:hypothetical protein